MPLFAVSPAGILCGAVVGIITVLIAAHSPAKQAAKVSPAAAVTGNTDEAKKLSMQPIQNFSRWKPLLESTMQQEGRKTYS